MDYRFVIMKIPILYLPKTSIKKYIYIERQYESKEYVIPIGCDCHPAYTLNALGIRKESFPFDWLNVDPIKGLSYVTDNIKSSFEFYLKDLHLNEDNNVVAKKYPFAEFLHEKDLIDNREDRLKMQRRVDRFKDYFDNRTVWFLYNITSESLENEEKLTLFMHSVMEFMQTIKPQDQLFMYIRYDESLNENAIICNKLISALEKIKNVKLTQYIRYRETQGIWGDEKYYFKLYKPFNLLKQLPPKIYLK
jgi:hypothetical protein